MNEYKKRTKLSRPIHSFLAAHELASSPGSGHTVDRVNSATAPYHASVSIVAYEADETVARTRIDGVHAAITGYVVVAAVAAYDIRLRSPVERIRAVSAG